MKKGKGISLEGKELEPKVIGYSYRKKSNFGRVIIIFAIFIVAVYYINDITVYLNKLFGKESSQTIKQIIDDERKIPDRNIEEEIQYYTLSDNLEIVMGDLLFNGFKYSDKSLSFVITSDSSTNVDYSNKVFYLGTYDGEKKAVDSIRIDLSGLSSSNSSTVKYNLTSDFSYLSIIDKTES